MLRPFAILAAGCGERTMILRIGYTGSYVPCGTSFSGQDEDGPFAGRAICPACTQSAEVVNQALVNYTARGLAEGGPCRRQHR